MATVNPLYPVNLPEEQKGLKLHHFDTLTGKQLTPQEHPETVKNSLAEYFAQHYDHEIQFRIGTIEENVTTVADLTKHDNLSLQFSSGDRFFFSNDETLRDRIFPLPSDAAAYGSNVFTECNRFHCVENAKVLVIDDETGENGFGLDPEQAKRLVADCQGKIDNQLHKDLGNEAHRPFQFRFGTNPQTNDPVHRLAKGTLAPRDLSQYTGGESFDLILPTSSFKGRRTEDQHQIQPGVYHWDFGLGNKTDAYSNRQSLGAQVLGFYPKTVETEISPIVEARLQKLAEIRENPRELALDYVEGEKQQRQYQQTEEAFLPHPEAESEEDISEISQILATDAAHYGQLLEHKKVTDTLEQYTQKQYKQLAMGQAIRFKGSLLQAHPDLNAGEICDPQLPNQSEIIATRAPTLNSNGVITLTNTHLVDSDAMKDKGVVYMNPTDAAAYLQGDFDGDALSRSVFDLRIAYERADLYPAFAAEVKERQVSAAFLPSMTIPTATAIFPLPKMRMLPELKRGCGTRSQSMPMR